MTTAQAVGSVLGEPTGEAAKAGPIAILVILLLCFACYFIFRSMSKHLRRVREEYPYGAAHEPAPPVPGRRQVPEGSPTSEVSRPAQSPDDERSPRPLTG